MESILVQIESLLEVFLLHLLPNSALLAVVAYIDSQLHSHMTLGNRRNLLTWFGEEQLVDNDVMRVNLVVGELLNEAFCLVQRQELGNAHADECCLVL